MTFRLPIKAFDHFPNLYEFAYLDFVSTVHIGTPYWRTYAVLGDTKYPLATWEAVNYRHWNGAVVEVTFKHGADSYAMSFTTLKYDIATGYPL